MDSNKAEVSTGLKMEKWTFTWRIENFDIVRRSDALIGEQKFEFKAGGSIGLETEWRVCLNVDKNTVGKGNEDNVNWIGIWLRCTKRPKGVNQLIGLEQFSIITKDKGRVNKTGGLTPERMSNYSESSYEFPQFIRNDGKGKEIPLIDGSLVVEMEFHLYAPGTPPPAMVTADVHGTVASVQEQFESVFMKKLQSDLKGLNFSRISDLSVKIVSKDKKEFSVSGGILSVRSPVFKTMLEVDMKEANTRVISIDDLLSKTITVLLQFIYSGSLHEDWSSPDVIVSLVYAAAKYKLPDLQEFLDNVLGMVCSKETAGQLLNLAGKLGMKKAVQEVLNRIKKDFTNYDDMLALLGLGCKLDFP